MNPAHAEHGAKNNQAFEAVQLTVTGPMAARSSKRKHLWPAHLLLYAVICCLSSACVSRLNSCIGMSGPNCDTVTAAPQVDNARFVMPTPMPVASPGPTPQLPSDAYWIKNGETMEARWDSYILYSTTPSVPACDPHVKPNPPTCERCNLANTAISQRDECSTVLLKTDFYLLAVLAFDGFSKQVTPTVPAGANTWGDVSAQRFVLTPTGNATLQLQAFVNPQTLVTSVPTLAEAKIFVVTSGMSQTVQYQLAPLTQTDPRATGVVFYSGTLPNGVSNSLTGVSDNFSPNLQVGAVRILIGKPDTDPASGQLRLRDATPLKPSRLVFIPNYQNDSVYDHDNDRCYADYSTKPDGDIDLMRCRGAYQNAATQLLGATPAYLKNDSGQQKLTWVAEFKTTEGAVIPPQLNSDQVVAIEFTIVAP